MSDQIQSIRDDLAFLKSMAADEGHLPWVVGGNFLAAGVIYGVPTVLAWAQIRGLIDIPGAWTGTIGLWATLLFVPISVVLSLKGPKPKPGSSTGRAFAAAWSGMGLTTITVVAVILIAGWRLHVPMMWQVWTSVCFALWGAAWWVVAMLRPRRGWVWVALGSLANALVNAFLVGSRDELLGCGIGILLWLGGPGLMILLQNRSRA
jgi:hypothetical protein